ncbi:MAG: outer membrane protein assembly factor BamD [Gemmatimonadota bacterium]
MFTGYAKVVAGLFSLALLGGCASSSEYQGLQPDELFDVGAREFDAGEWDKAVTVFERLLFADPTYPRLVEARMYLARAYYNKGEFITSISEFTRIVDRNPGHALAPQASLGICQSYMAQSPHVQRDQAFTVQAWNSCQNTMTDFRGTEVAAEAEALRNQMEGKLAEKIFIAGDFYYKRKLYHSGIIYFNDLLSQYPRSQWASQALLRLHQSYFSLEWVVEAEEVRQRLLREFPDSEAAKVIGAGGAGGLQGPP